MQSVVKNTFNTGIKQSAAEQITLQKLVQASMEDIHVFSQRVTAEDIEILVEGGQKLTAHIKAAKSHLEQIKTAMKAIATLKEEHEFTGRGGSLAKISDKVVRVISVDNFKKFLAKMNKKRLLDSFISVKLTPVLKSFGEEALKDYTDSEIKKYEACAFTKVK